MGVGGFPNPNRSTTLVDAQPRLQGEYNGVNISVNPDGSCSLVFNGATDNNGNPTNPSQGVTKVAIATDGSFSVTNTATTFNMAKSGDITITATGNINLTNQGTTNIMTTGDTTISTQGDLSVKASGKVNVTSGGDTSVTSGGNANITASGNAVVKAAQIELNGEAGMVLTTMTDPLVDLITGVPTMGVPTVLAGS